MRTLRVDRFTVFLVALGALGAALILLRESTYGVGISPDSVLYVSTAQNLLEGNGFVYYWGYYWGTYLNAPPLYPLVLAFSGLFGVDVVSAAGYVNSAAFGLTIFVTTMWVRSHVQSRFLVIWAGCACILSVPLIYVSTFAWTEPLFILFTVLSLFTLDHFLSTRQRWFLLLAAVCSALACLTRYPGVIVVFTSLIFLVSQRCVTISDKLKYSVFYFVISIAPLYIWMLRNYVVYGSIFGKYPSERFAFLLVVPIVVLFLVRSANWSKRVKITSFAIIAIVSVGVWILRNFLVSNSLTGRYYPLDFPSIPVLHTTSSEFIRWMLGDGIFKIMSRVVDKITGISMINDHTIAGVSLTVGFLMLTAIVVGFLLLRLRSREVPLRVGYWSVPAVFSVLYVFVAISFLSDATSLPVRYLTPLYIPALVVVTLILNEFFRDAEKKNPLGAVPLFRKWNNANLTRTLTVSIPMLALVAGLSLWILQFSIVNYRDINHRMENGYGYSSREWTDSETVRYLRSSLPDGRIWTNQAVALHFWLDLEGHEKIYPLELAIATSPRHLLSQARVAGEDVYFVWFHNASHPDYGYGVDDITSLAGVEPVMDLEDGVIVKGKKFSDDAVILNEDPLVKSALGNARIIIRSIFNVYLNEEENMLIYVKNDCTEVDISPATFLHVVPINKMDLPDDRQQYGYDNLDFTSGTYEFLSEGLCLATRDLPDYEIATIRTGQYIDSGQIWREGFDFAVE